MRKTAVTTQRETAEHLITVNTYALCIIIIIIKIII